MPVFPDIDALIRDAMLQPPGTDVTLDRDLAIRVFLYAHKGVAAEAGQIAGDETDATSLRPAREQLITAHEMLAMLGGISRAMFMKRRDDGVLRIPTIRTVNEKSGLYRLADVEAEIKRLAADAAEPLHESGRI